MLFGGFQQIVEESVPIDCGAVEGGFHLFQLEAGDPAADQLIEMIGKALLAGKTEYYTGHCTGDYAYERLSAILNGRLHRIMGGTELEF